jgi:hypothetical protein
MSKYTVNLAAFGLPDDMVQVDTLPSVFYVKRKGEIWNSRTGKIHTENFVRLEDKTVYEEGYDQAFNRLFSLVNKDATIRKYFEVANYVELQVWLWIDDDVGVPSLHFEPEHISFLNSLKAHVDVDIYSVAEQGV